MNEIALIASLAILTAVGSALAFFGARLARPLLRWVGAVIGGISGATIGFGVLPVLNETSTIESQLFGGIIGLIVGLLLGYLFTTFISRLIAMAGGFVVASIASTGILAGEEIYEVIMSEISKGPITDPAKTVEAIITAPVLETAAVQQAIPIALLLGVICAGGMLLYYIHFVQIATTVFGAALLGVAFPLWMDFLKSGMTVEAGVSQFSFVWFIITLAVGGGYQLYRYFEESDSGAKDILGD